MEESGKNGVGDAFVASVTNRKRLGWWLLLGSVSLVALAAIGLAAWQIKQYQQRKVEHSPAHQAKVYEAITEQANQYGDLWKYDDESRTLEDYLATNPDSKYYDKTVLELANTYLNGKHYDVAVSRYRSLENNQDYQLDAWRGLAAAYLSKGDKVRARQYRQKVVDVMKTKTDPESVFRLTTDEAQLDALNQ
jgi:tetratricopeptide (TPR) repeat protein